MPGEPCTPPSGPAPPAILLNVFVTGFVNLYTRDIEAGLHFYRDLLGFAETFRTPADGVPEHVELQLNGFMVGLGTVEAAKRVNGKCVTVVTGRDITIPRGYQIAVMIENLKRAAEVAEKAGLVLCVETVSALRFGTMLLNNIDEAYMVVAAVDNPAVQLAYDFGHVTQMDGEVLSNLRACWEMTAIIQVADIPGRLELGSGAVAMRYERRR